MGTLPLNIVSIDEMPAVIEPPPEFMYILIDGGSISKLLASVKLLDSISPIFSLKLLYISYKHFL